MKSRFIYDVELYDSYAYGKYMQLCECEDHELWCHGKGIFIIYTSTTDWRMLYEYILPDQILSTDLRIQYVLDIHQQLINNILSIHKIHET